jgi:hypothetical protein
MLVDKRHNVLFRRDGDAALSAITMHCEAKHALPRTRRHREGEASLLDATVQPALSLSSSSVRSAQRVAECEPAAGRRSCAMGGSTAVQEPLDAPLASCPPAPNACPCQLASRAARISYGLRCAVRGCQRPARGGGEVVSMVAGGALRLEHFMFTHRDHCVRSSLARRHARG